LLQSAGLHADQNGFGLRDLLKQKRAWFLTRFVIDMVHYPSQYEDIKVDTWIKDVGTVFTSRCFEVFNKEQQKIASARSTWAMIDLKSRRPMGLQEFSGIGLILESKDCDSETPAKIPAVQNPEPQKSIRVAYSDLDMNSHVNSMRYIHWMVDLFPLDLFKEKIIQKIELNYLSEILFNDPIDLFLEKETGGESYIIEIKNSQTGKSACRGRVIWAD